MGEIDDGFGCPATECEVSIWVCPTGRVDVAAKIVEQVAAVVE